MYIREQKGLIHVEHIVGCYFFVNPLNLTMIHQG